MSTRTEERYAAAVRSSHLEVTEHDGDVDLIIAAGMAETLGVLLARLKGEWDGQKATLTLHRNEQNRLHREADRLDREAAVLRRDPNKETQEDSWREAGRKEAEAVWMRAESEREGVTARALILMEMRSLGPAKQALYNLAMRQAAKKAVDSTEAEIAALVGRVLDVWLDRLCLPCNGVGTSGGYGSPKVICSKCGGSGSRRNSRLSPATGEHYFGLWLLGVMDAKCSDALKKISQKTRK